MHVYRALNILNNFMSCKKICQTYLKKYTFLECFIRVSQKHRDYPSSPLPVYLPQYTKKYREFHRKCMQIF